MATKEFPAIPHAVTWETDFSKDKLSVRFIAEPNLMHSCPMTNTYVLDPSVLRDPDGYDMHTDSRLELLWDISQMDEAEMPFGQIVFLSYDHAGEFIIEGATDKWKQMKVGAAFESFGYSEIRIVANYLLVSEKDKFKLMLKFGY